MTSQRPPYPQTNDPELWLAYWQEQGQPWRRKPEIDSERQTFLHTCQAIQPDIETGIYPFAHILLTRADVEWLLATLDDERGPVQWDEPQDRARIGLDLRGAYLYNADLRALPLARLQGGLTLEACQSATREQKKRAALRLDGANLAGAHLEGAILGGATLYATVLDHAHLEESCLAIADLSRSRLQYAQFSGACLATASLLACAMYGAQFEAADLSHAHLEGADMRAVNLRGAELAYAHLDGAYLDGANLSGASFNNARKEPSSKMHRTSGASLHGAVLTCVLACNADLRWVQAAGVTAVLAQFVGTTFSQANVEGANFSGALLEGADLSHIYGAGMNLSDARSQRADPCEAHLEGANLREAWLESACLRGVYLAGATLSGAHLEGADLSGAQLDGQQVSPETLDHIRRWLPMFPADLPPVSLAEAIVDDTTVLPSHARLQPIRPTRLRSSSARRRK